jgi:hypothetical protein
VEQIISRTIPVNISWSTHLASNLPTIDGDPSQLNQVIMNLCVNAIEANHGNGFIKLETNFHEKLPPEILARTQLPQNQYISVVVHDNGTGIPKEIQHHLFEPFFTTKTKSENPGTGIGLSTVYGIISSHGGSIEVNPPGYEKTTFVVYLPIGKLSKHEKQVVATKFEPQKGNILLVEDEKIMRETVRQMLQRIGFTTLEAADGHRAIQIYQDNFPTTELVIIDLHMPGINGFETFQELQQINPEVKVLLITGYGEDEKIQSMLQSGIKEVLLKPFNTQTLANTIEKILN